MSEYFGEFELEATTAEEAELEVENTVVIPRDTIQNLLNLLDGQQLPEGATIASTIEAVKEYV